MSVYFLGKTFPEPSFVYFFLLEKSFLAAKICMVNLVKRKESHPQKVFERTLAKIPTDLDVSFF